MPLPTDVLGLRRFLGMAAHCGKFSKQGHVKRKTLSRLPGEGAVLAQEDDEGREYVVEFASRTCQGAEPNYASYVEWWANISNAPPPVRDAFTLPKRDTTGANDVQAKRTGSVQDAKAKLKSLPNYEGIAPLIIGDENH
eukprot:jgi/Tetstr1/420394/TSEL_011510.t1